MGVVRGDFKGREISHSWGCEGMKDKVSCSRGLVREERRGCELMWG